MKFREYIENTDISEDYEYNKTLGKIRENVKVT